MKKLLKYPLFILAALLVVFPFSGSEKCSANAAPPPSIFIIVIDAPPGLEIYLEPAGIQGHKSSKAYETYFSFYQHDLQPDFYSFTVVSSEGYFEITLDEPVEGYSNVYTLDLKTRTFSPGKSKARSALLVFFRFAITLVIEGLVFYLFGYRKRRSWLVFFGVNLVTQLTLLVSLSGTLPFRAAYIIFGLIFAEFLILFIEMVAFLTLVTEYRRLRTAVYVVIANILSLAAGIYLLTALPI